ncbi:MAG: HAD hydrolase family protein, partial [Nitrospinota bacterium]|nr:HAD hydrolase family protein [Nitrospinota bacterium]
RNHAAAYPPLHKVNLTLPVILFNGVYLTEFHSGHNVLTSEFLPRPAVEDLLALASSLKVDPFMFSPANRIYHREISNPGSQNYVEEQGSNGRLHYVTDFNFLKTEEVSGSLFIGNRQALEPLYRGLKERYSTDLNLYFAEDITMREYYWLQVFHRNADKGRMVEKLAAHLKIPLAETVVFGDYLNDLEMFKVAGKALAVGNALPEIKQAAHQVIDSNDVLGVIAYLESLWQG